MSSPEAFEAFKNTLDDNWSATPVVYENHFDEPSASRGAYVFVEVFGDTYNQETTGAPGENMWVETGMTYMHVLVKRGTGSLTGRQHCKALMGLFREVAVAPDMVITEMSIGAGEPGREFPNFWAMTLTINWSRVDFTTVP